jgi:hypothetical protein
MKFFSFTQISSFPSLYWVVPDDAQDILEPFHQLYSLYSMPHIQQPRNGAPSISVSIVEIQFEDSVKSVLLVSSLTHSHSEKEDTQYAYVHDLCLLHPSRFERSHCYIFERSNPLCAAGYPLVKYEIDTSSPTQGGLSYNLHCGLSFDIQPYSKSKTFIETESSCSEIAGF